MMVYVSKGPRSEQYTDPVPKLFVSSKAAPDETRVGESNAAV